MMTDVLGRERYRLDRALGSGAMGTVHLARDTILDRVVAIKVLADHLAADDAFRHRFVREAQLAARLCHPNIVQVFDAGDDDGRPFLVMEYVEGETVAERLAAHRPFSGDALVRLTAELSAGLAHAHAEGIVHRDLKPHNVLLRRDGVAKLTDFGIARAMEDHGLTEIGTVLGTAAFMAPEQAAGSQVGPAADVYALGALIRHVAAGPVPPALEALADAALAHDPAARPTAAEVQCRLADLTDDPTGRIPTGPVPNPEAAPTEVSPATRTAGGTEVLTAPDNGADPAAWHRFAAPVIAAAVILFVLFAMAQPDGSAEEPATTSPSVAPVPPAADPAQAARNLADWLRSQAATEGQSGR